MTRVRLYIQVGDHPSSQDYEGWIDISIMSDAMTKLDLPSHDSMGFERMLCTPAEEIIRTKRDRKRIAVELSHRLSEHFLAFFDTLDTCNGYPLEPAKIKSNEPKCPVVDDQCKFYIWQEDSNGEVAIDHCTHKDNPSDYEGNCKSELCPRLKALMEFKII
ncbi:MAG: hypothetical protein OEY89_13470 [Gammaproteobacteria bacterium]|nr:hypothetical protein [Gammaproteobacteria bacterium]